MDSHVFVWPLWARLLPIALALGGVALAAVIDRKNPKARWLALLPLLFVVAPFGCCCAPMLLHDKVVVGPERITQTTGFFFAPNVKRFEYADVRLVRIVTKRVGLPGREHDAVIWEFVRKDGSTVDHDPSDNWELHTDEIRPLLEARGVRFE